MQWLTKRLRFSLAPELDLADVAATLPFTYTGADLYALCSDAMLHAITRRTRAVDVEISRLNAEIVQPTATADGQGDGTVGETESEKITPATWFDRYATAEDLRVEVGAEDFRKAARELVPSVSAEELRHYERVRREFEGGGGGGDAEGGEGAARTGMQTSGLERAGEAGEVNRIEQVVVQRTRDKGKGKAQVQAQLEANGFTDLARADDELYS